MRFVPLLAVILSAATVAPTNGQIGRDERADLVVLNAKITTMSAGDAAPTALAVRDGVFVAVGAGAEIAALVGERTRVVDAGGRRIIPGLNDSHLHAVRAGRFYNLELRWDGVASLERGLAMIREQAARTPEGQWVRVVGGWSPFQFREKRMPTVAELDAAAPDTPVFVLFLYSRGFLNRAGVRALGLTPDSEPPPGGRFEFVPGGGAILYADPDPTILYSTIARLPELSPADQVNSTRHFFAELNRFGITSAIDPGGGGHAYPDDYGAAKELAARAGSPLRLSFFLFAQKPGRERAEFERWTASEQVNRDLAAGRADGWVLEGAGENLVWSAGDFENFASPRPELAAKMDAELRAVVANLALHDWPMRIHATYDESITRILNVLEPEFRAAGYRGRWFIDHAETIGATNIARIRALGGGIAIQDRMAFAGELFAERYGAQAAASAPPLRALLDAGVPLGAGTDGTRVSSYNPWVAISWMVTGRTVGGTELLSPQNRITREEALRLYTTGSAWFSGDEGVKGQIAPGRLADFAILSADYFDVPVLELSRIESVLTVIGGDVVYAAAPFTSLAPAPLPPVRPRWSPVAVFGGYQQSPVGP
jgi:predicted amidohydrolase YtcJ